jgi:hypothetical protein
MGRFAAGYFPGSGNSYWQSGHAEVTGMASPKGSCMPPLIARLAKIYSGAKGHVITATGMSESQLHIHAGLAIFVLASLLLRRKMRSRVPVALVVAFAVLNEIVDLMVDGEILSLEPFTDVANTVFWPLVLFALARRR